MSLTNLAINLIISDNLSYAEFRKHHTDAVALAMFMVDITAPDWRSNRDPYNLKQTHSAFLKVVCDDLDLVKVEDLVSRWKFFLQVYTDLECGISEWTKLMSDHVADYSAINVFGDESPDSVQIHEPNFWAMIHEIREMRGNVPDTNPKANLEQVTDILNVVKWELSNE